MKNIFNYVFASVGRFLFICFLLGAFMGTGILVIFFYVSLSLPPINNLEDYAPPVTSEILTKDGHLLLEAYKERRYIAKYEEMPRVMVDALLAAEDDKFFEHDGVDYLGVMRAMAANLKAGKITQGGSTLTQQVAKSLLLSREKSYIRKMKDFMLARKIEEKFSKEEILYLYLNQMYFGGGNYGIKAAVRGYFGKDLHELSIAEAALLAGLLAAPGKYSPYVNPEYAKARQKYVLRRMFEIGKISSSEYEEALQEEIKMQVNPRNRMAGGHFTDWIRQLIVNKVGEDRFYTEGFRIITTLDWELQKKAEEAVEKGVRDLDKRQGFKGPLRKIDLGQGLEEFEIKFRKNIYKEASSFFLFKVDGQTDYEFRYRDQQLSGEDVVAEDEYHFVKNLQSVEDEKLTADRFESGNVKEDPLWNFLDEEKTFEAIVTKVNNAQRLIYVSLGGVRGIIPYEHFRWAHERIISDERHYNPYVTRPSQIVSPGDVVLVRVKKKKSSLWFNLYSDFRQKVTKESLIADLKKQQFVECALEQEPEVQGALFSMSPFNGHILALVGGYDFYKSQFNRVLQAHRQPGSSFKPFIYAVALENGFTPASILNDSPSALAGFDESLNWKPRNYDGEFLGPVTFRYSLEKSRNVPTIKLAEEVGVQKILDFAKRVGMNAQLAPDLSLSLGSFGITLKDLVTTYSIFPNGGKRVKPMALLSVRNRLGQEFNVADFEYEEEVTTSPENVEEAQVEVAQKIKELNMSEEEKKIAEAEKPVNEFHANLNDKYVYDERLAYLMSNILRGVMIRGTGKNANLGTYVAGKTGTTNNYVDAWFVGFSAHVVTGVWTGFDDNKTLGWPESGALAALPIWKEYMEFGLKKFPEEDFSIPEGIVNVRIERDTGKLAGRSSKDTIMEAFVVGTEPGAAKEEQEAKEVEAEQTTPSWVEDDYYLNQ